MTDKKNAIEVHDITKKFKVYLDKGNQLKERLLFRNRNRYEERWVLNGISFNVKKGEAIGLIGRNGCGKSTTLKLLTRIMYPDSGTIEMNGRVSSLIELGAGFHPDMSGRENIYTNAAIFGLTKKEINERLQDIIDFSEMEPFLDNPVRTYSSGMYMRLAFSVAINVNADILLIDEILAVGDINFQAKCFNKLREIKAQGTTIVIVSHSLNQIEQICDRSIWIHDGKIRAEGIPVDVHSKYVEFMGQKRQVTAEQAPEGEAAGQEENKKRWGNGHAHISSVIMTDDEGHEKNAFRTGEKVNIVMDYNVNEPVRDAIFGIAIFRSDGLHCYGTNTRIEKFDPFDLEKSGTVRVKIDKLDLLPGQYTLDISIESDHETAVDYFKEAFHFKMYSAVSDVGVMHIDHTWEI